MIKLVRVLKLSNSWRLMTRDLIQTGKGMD